MNKNNNRKNRGVSVEGRDRLIPQIFPRVKERKTKMTEEGVCKGEWATIARYVYRVVMDASEIETGRRSCDWSEGTTVDYEETDSVQLD